MAQRRSTITGIALILAAAGGVADAAMAAEGRALNDGARSPRAAESRSYVVSWFFDANYYNDESDCPDGLNISSIEFYRRDLARIGHSQDAIEKALKDFPGEGGLTQPWIPLVTVRGNGKDNVYANPWTAPDPRIKTLKGRFAYGFDLDGKGAASADAFEEPETHEKGIDNQMYRTMGCIRSFRSAPIPADARGKNGGGIPAGARPGLPETHWDILRNSMPAWLVTITAEKGFKQDGPVTVALERSLDRVTRDVAGDGVQRDMTFRIDPDPRSRNLLRGSLVNGQIRTEPSDISIAADPYIVPVFNFTHARMRIAMNDDGTIRGFIGAYQPWYPLWFGLARAAHIAEYAASVDIPGLWYAMRRNADGAPDPQSGEATAISSTYQLDAIPAFTVSVNNRTASAASAGR